MTEVQSTRIDDKRIEVVFGDKPEAEDANFWVHISVDLGEINADWSLGICREIAVKRMLRELYERHRLEVMKFPIRIWEDALDKAGLAEAG